MSRVPDMSVLSTSVWVQQAACKGCKGKRGLRKPSSSHPEKPSSSRQKRVFLRSDPIGKNGGFCPYTPYKTVSTHHPLGKACKGCKGKRGLPEPSSSHPEKPSSSRQKRVFLRSDPIGKNGGFCLYTPYKQPAPPPSLLSRVLRTSILSTGA